MSFNSSDVNIFKDTLKAIFANVYVALDNEFQ